MRRFPYLAMFLSLLIGQALAEAVPLVSADPVFDAYGVARLW